MKWNDLGSIRNVLHKSSCLSKSPQPLSAWISTCWPSRSSAASHIHPMHSVHSQSGSPRLTTCFRCSSSSRALSSWQQPNRRASNIVVKANAKGKTKEKWVCNNCGKETPQSYGKCPDCGLWDTMEKVVVQPEQVASSMGGAGAKAAAQARQRYLDQLGPEDMIPSLYESQGKPTSAPRSRPTQWAGSSAYEGPQLLANIQARSASAKAKIQLPSETGAEISRVLGGGVTRGSMVLVAGDPGIGKSTLMLQLASLLAQSAPPGPIDPSATPGPGEPPPSSTLPAAQASADALLGIETTVDDGDEEEVEEGEEEEEEEDRKVASVPPPGCVLYFTGEEALEQVADRAERLGITGADATSGLYLMASIKVEDIIDQIGRCQPVAVIVDSINTMFLEDATGSKGSPTQIRECAVALTGMSKGPRLPVVFLVGHVTKDGMIAGPKVLEHVVDVVLSLEGEEQNSLRVLRCSKNRFGPSDQIGIFSMRDVGLVAETEPSKLFCRQSSSNTQCTAVGCFLEGKGEKTSIRPILVEVQALSAVMPENAEGPPARSVQGLAWKRLDLLTKVLEKYTPLKRLTQTSLYLNVVSGLTLTEPAADLTVALAIASSVLDKPFQRGMCAFGEIDLVGNLRFVKHVEKRLAECSKMGFTKVIVPAACEVDIVKWKPLQVVPCSSVLEAMQAAFGPLPQPRKNTRPGPRQGESGLE